MGLGRFREELDFLTGRYTMKKRPIHGRLFTSPSRLAYGPELLENVSIEGTSMRVPDTSRSYPSPSSDNYRRAGVSEARCRKMQERAAATTTSGPMVCAVEVDVRVIITPRMRQRLSALDLQHSPTVEPVTYLLRCRVQEHWLGTVLNMLWKPLNKWAFQATFEQPQDLTSVSSM